MATNTRPTQSAIEATVLGLSKRDNDSLVDFIVKCSGSEWNVHKVVLAMHSPVLGATVTADFLESHQGCLELTDTTPQCAETLVHYLYHHSYDYDASEDVNFDVGMCILADKYDIPALKQLATEYFKRKAATKSPYDKEYCDAIRQAYDASSATEDIRSHMVYLLVEHDALAKIKDEEGSALAAVMREYGDVGIDVAMSLRAGLPASVECSVQRSLSSRIALPVIYEGIYHRGDWGPSSNDSETILRGASTGTSSEAIDDDLRTSRKRRAEEAMDLNIQSMRQRLTSLDQ